MQIQKIGLYRPFTARKNNELSAFTDGIIKETSYGKYGEITEEKTIRNGKLIKDEIYHYKADGKLQGHTKKYYFNNNEYIEKLLFDGEKHTKKFFVNGKPADKEISYLQYIKQSREVFPREINYDEDENILHYQLSGTSRT